jgi:hypothetical protein
MEKQKQRKKSQTGNSTKTLTEPFAAANACNICMLRYSAKDMRWVEQNEEKF